MIINYRAIKNFKVFVLATFMLVVLCSPISAAEVMVSQSIRVAPGDLLPISVKLVNFGSTRRIDVTILYKIVGASGKDVYSESETVAVDTTASFTKQVRLPDSIAHGNYKATSNIYYSDQTAPAVSEFNFTVEPKIFGWFLSDLVAYGVGSGALAVVSAMLGLMYMKNRRKSRVAIYEYSDKPKSERIYYEIVSDTITQMRMHVGDEAIEIAKSISDLVIDDETGKVLDIKSDPSKIIALLVLRYETLLGRRVSFKIRQKDAEAQMKTEPVKKNIDVVRKYFE